MKPFLMVAVLFMSASAVLAQYRFPPVFEDYNGGSALAAKTGKPLVTFVGVRPYDVEGAVVCQALELPGFEAHCIVVSHRGFWVKTLPMNAMHGDICAVVTNCKAVSQKADPFGQCNQRSTIVQRDGREGRAASLQFNASHRCPNCGTTQTIISGRGPTPGTHVHTCPRCSTSWYH